jgi:hypothetical protein
VSVVENVRVYIGEHGAFAGARKRKGRYREQRIGAGDRCVCVCVIGINENCAYFIASEH